MLAKSRARGNPSTSSLPLTLRLSRGQSLKVIARGRRHGLEMGQATEPLTSLCSPDRTGASAVG